MKNKKVILSSILSLVLCLSLIAGGTFALFTSESKTNIAINSGKVEVVSTVEDLQLYSYTDINMTTLEGTLVENLTEFPNGGTATYADGTLTLDKLMPGDGVTFTIKTANNSNVDIKCRTIISGVSGNGLINALKVKINDVEYAGEAISEWTALAVGETLDDIAVSIELPVDAGNAYMNKTASLSIAVEAVQGNTIEVIDKWDGTVGELSDDYVIDTAAELAAFAAAVNAGDTFEGKEVKLNSNIDLAGFEWTPISSFAGTFDGQGYTISNLSFERSDSQTINNYAPIGLFDTITATGSIKDLTLKNASATLNGYYSVGMIAHLMQGKAENCVMKNVTINAEGFLYKSGAMFGTVTGGAVINQCSADNVTITITGTDNGNKVGGLIGLIEGTADNRAQVNGATITNVTINASYKAKYFGGFVGEIYYATMKDCAVENLQFTVNYYQQIGGFAATVAQGTELDNCDVIGATFDITNTGRFGGFAGRTRNVTGSTEAVVIKNCDVTGLYLTVSGKITSYVSGFSGNTTGEGPTTMENCSVEGVIDMTGVTSINESKAGIYETVKSDNPDNDSIDCTENVTVIK